VAGTCQKVYVCVHATKKNFFSPVELPRRPRPPARLVDIFLRLSGPDYPQNRACERRVEPYFGGRNCKKLVEKFRHSPLGKYNAPYSRKIVVKTSKKPGNPADFRAKHYSGRHLVDLRQNAKMQPLAPQGVAFIFW